MSTLLTTDLQGTVAAVAMVAVAMVAAATVVAVMVVVATVVVAGKAMVLEGGRMTIKCT